MFISNAAKVYYASYSKNTLFIRIFFNFLAKFQDTTPPKQNYSPQQYNPTTTIKLKLFDPLSKYFSKIFKPVKLQGRVHAINLVR